jgi:hypothetical protein
MEEQAAAELIRTAPVREAAKKAREAAERAAAAEAERAYREAEQERKNKASLKHALLCACFGPIWGGLLLGLAGCVSCVVAVAKHGLTVQSPFNLLSGLLYGAIIGVVIGPLVGFVMGQMGLDV